MKELVIIDGYNYLFSIIDNIGLKDNELEEIREKFIEELAEYRNITGYDIIVVFDSYKYPKSIKSSRRYKGIEMIFSGSKTTADHIIEELSNIKKEYERKIIVTSDNTAQTVVFKENIYRKSSREFFMELQHLKKELKSRVKKINMQNRSAGFSSLEKRLKRDQIEKISGIIKSFNTGEPKNKKDR